MELTSTEKLGIMLQGKGRMTKAKAAELTGYSIGRLKDGINRMNEQNDKYCIEITSNGMVAVHHVRWTGPRPANFRELIRTSRFPDRSWRWAHSLMPGR